MPLTQAELAAMPWREHWKAHSFQVGILIGTVFGMGICIGALFAWAHL